MPSGPNNTSGISTSTTAGVGIGLNNPQGRFDIKSTATLGGLKIVTTTENVIGGTATTPYALKVQYQQSVDQFPTDETVALLNGQGRLSLGNFTGITPLASNYLNAKNGAAVYYNNGTYLSLLSGAQGNTFNWNSNASNSLYKNLNFSFSNASPFFTLTSTNRVGIGTQTPTSALQVIDNTGSNNPQNQVYGLEVNAGAANGGDSRVFGLQINNDGLRNEDYALKVNTYWGSVFRLANSGHLYLGESLNGNYWNGDYRLYVENGIRTEKIRVDIAADNDWADFVFDEGYELMSTQDLAAFIAENKHLPNVPSAAQVAKEGIDLAEMNAILLRQIEELTLRVIELEKLTSK